jgi:succinyl-diaminopimelate desuccinylase
MAIGGGTYARALPMGAAFGPEFPGEDAPVHEPNEYITVENIIKMAGIYKRAIEELMK